NARDWSITRNRFWGSPVPVWKSDNPEYPRVDAYGSLAELERDFGVKVTDLHRPYIDELTRPNPDDPTWKSTMRRVEDVMDVWVDSGSMPYAQVHYPFENQEWFDNHYPGDFIVEYIGQTRGWFYVLHVLATGIFDKPAFRSAISHGIVLGSDGRKMSKSLRNYPDVSEVFERDGADAMRWYLMSSSILKGGNLIVTEEGIRDSVRQVLLPLWSVYYFFTLYANNCARLGGGNGYQAQPLDETTIKGLGPLDRYILAKTADLAGQVKTQLDGYDIPGACESVRVFLDVLTNWYVRTQRERFWAEDKTAFDTLFAVLETLCRVMAPLAPLVTEEVWRGLTGGRSVHLQDWPVPPPSWQADTDALVKAMDQVRAVVSTALSLRKANQIRVRQPLAELVVACAEPSELEAYRELLATELNVKKVTLVPATDVSQQQYGVQERLAVNARAAGPRLGKSVQTVIKAAKAGQWHHDAAGNVVVSTSGGEVPLEPSEYTLETVIGKPESKGAPEKVAELAAAILPTGGFTVLDLAMTAELVQEGFVRDVIRDVQEARKQAGLEVSDRIDLTLYVPDNQIEAIDTHHKAIKAETLAKSISIVPQADDKPIAVQVAKAAKDEPFGNLPFDTDGARDYHPNPQG
ncbi:MAG: class I tRNA ligase family protein, partial [Cellulomonadaceae bacterium]|nr:class I tRNA ligase family protein [Cellulomonadaceae bacterium]